MNNCYDTDSERVFAELCRSKGYVVEKIPEDPPHKTPDFKIRTGGIIIMAEVKQFDLNDVGRAIENAVRQGEVHVGAVDFDHDGGLCRKLGKQAAQLLATSGAGIPTLGVISSNRIFGQTDYQVEHALEKGTVVLPAEISAVLHERNENLQG